jgi:hypothetical protein
VEVWWTTGSVVDATRGSTNFKKKLRIITTRTCVAMLQDSDIPEISLGFGGGRNSGVGSTFARDISELNYLQTHISIGYTPSKLSICSRGLLFHPHIRSRFFWRVSHSAQNPLVVVACCYVVSSKLPLLDGGGMAKGS